MGLPFYFYGSKKLIEKNSQNMDFEKSAQNRFYC